MRKILISIICLVATMQIFAQEHLKFKGVEINGTKESFIQKMTATGLKISGVYQDGTMLEGEFAGFKGCEIFVSTPESNNLVSQLSIKLPSHENWKDIYNEYKELKSMLIEKYGNPSKVTENFNSSYNGFDYSFEEEEGDIIIFSALIFGNCNYQSIFTSSKGTIELSIDNDGTFGFIKLKYKDKINSQSVRKSAIDDL